MEHNVTTYPVRFHTETSKAVLPNTRLAVIRWKATKEKDGSMKPARAAVCVDIPKVEVSVTPAVLATALNAAFLDLQDEFIRTKVEEAYAAGKESLFFTYDELSTENLANYLSAKATSGKLSGDTIAAWFTANLRDTLEEKFAAIPDVTDEQVAKAVKDYGDSFTKLASPAWNPPTKLATQLQSAAKQAKEDRVTTQLLARLENMLKPKTESLELSL